MSAFQDLKHHVEEYGCNLDHLYEEAHMATNCINGHVCIIEKLKAYSVPTLCHYFYELGIPPYDRLAGAYETYVSLRNELADTVSVPRNEDNHKN